MSKKLSTNSSQYISKIAAAGSKVKGYRKSALFGDFLKQYYRHAPSEYLREFPPETLLCAAWEHWKFILERGARTPRKIRVFNPDKKNDGWESERTIVETCVPDSPFILDSLTSELTEKGYKIYEVIHPILKLKRDKSGKITKIFDRETEGAQLESVMHFQISYIPNKTEIKALEKSLNTTLSFVSMTIADWKPMLAQTRDIVSHLDTRILPFPKEEIDEVKDFLNWVIGNNFIMLGYCKYDFFDKSGKFNPKAVKDSQLGIFKSTSNDAKPLGIAALPEQSRDALIQPSLLEITKSSKKSIVHRPVHMDYIGIKRFDRNGKVIGEHRILGLFTSSVYFQSARLIPIIRKKIDAVVEHSGLTPDGHSGKALLAVLESYPRDELLQITVEDLFRISMGIVELQERPSTRLFIRKDLFSRFVSCLVFIPRDQFNTQIRQKIQSILEKAYSGVVTDFYTQVTESPLARVHMLVKLDDTSQEEPDIRAIEAALIEVTCSWMNGLRETLVQRVGERRGEKLFNEYVDAFPESFKELYHFGGTFRDIMKMEEAYDESKLTLELDLYKLLQDREEYYQLKLFHPETPITLSEILPILENMGFHAIDELTFFVEPSHMDVGVWVHHFRLEVSRTLGNGINLEDFKEEFEDAMFHIWHGEIEDDALNKLILRANIRWRDIVMLRAYCKYLQQINFPYSMDFMTSAVARLPEIATLLVELFHARFSTAVNNRSRTNKVKKIRDNIEAKLAGVTDVAEDRVVRQLCDTISATLRTNYFQTTVKNGDIYEDCKDYISFKLDSGRVPNLPLPHPHAEIFVYSVDVEGIHLRGGKVARGGLRWSDRREDFRTEVLGLVKAQMVKNAVIVPVGSKGGFVVKHPVRGSRDEVIAQGVECYRTYLRGLLDITDNIVKDKITPPKDVVRHDDDDPYLVVAADKGTATFSDIANGIAQDYGFWLDDAFASGGSDGYDHKKMGITARGAWISVQRHFMEMCIDIQKEDFTVVGIGDMAGDVFGNGMLLSKHIRLVGAFNHMHIFIDPNPDSAESWKERKRLFAKPRSTWDDYNKKLISTGGGIFSRQAKSIRLTKQIRELFDIDSASISPDELIKKILTARMDLLWNGGIGTYVKAEDESHESVGDKANDSLRVDGKDLRCKVIGEGGNLGFTQRGRIEYALNGGRINTDAIDNSAGVDCSDHEVNIKIALNKAVKAKKISLTQRNKLLVDMTDEVAQLVLRDNVLQTLAITIGSGQSSKYMDQKSRLMRTLETSGLLDRRIEFLPDDEALVTRQAIGKGMTRPELSVMIAYSKIDIYGDLIGSNLPDDEYFSDDLVNYFPVDMRRKFRNEILSHELRREIIATAVSNSIVNRVGTTFFRRVKDDTGMEGCNIARAYVVVRDAFGLRDIWNEIEKNSSKISTEMQNRLYLDVSRLVQGVVSWLLRNSSHPLNITGLVGLFKPGIKALSECMDGIISPTIKEVCNEKLQKYLNEGVPRALAQKVANLEVMASACDIVYVSQLQVSGGGKLPVRIAGEVYYELGEKLKLGWLRNAVQKLPSGSHWDSLAVQTMTETLFDQQMRLTADVVRLACKGNSCGGALDEWSAEHVKELPRYEELINDLMRHEVIDHSMLTIAVRRVETLFHK